MESLNKEEVKLFVFDSYENLLTYAKDKYSKISFNGSCIEDLVNESIVNIFDNEKLFLSESEITSFLKKSIDTVFYNEKELMKDSKFTTQKNNKGEEFNIIENRYSAINYSQEFLSCYSILELARFGPNNEKRKCPKCQGRKFYETNLHVSALKCATCGNRLSLTSNTYLSNTKLSYATILRAINVLCKKTYSSYQLSRYVGIRQANAYKLKYLIDSVINTIKIKETNAILSKILTEVSSDSHPIIWLEKRTIKISFDDIITIRRIYKMGLYPKSEIRQIFGINRKQLDKILLNKTYVNLKLTIKSTSNNKNNALQAEETLFTTLDNKCAVVNSMYHHEK